MQSLFEQGWSKRRIAAELGISRNTLERYLGSRSDQAGHDGATKNKLKICLDWLKEQALTGEENSEMLRQRLQAEKQIHVSQRTLLRAIHQWKHASSRLPAPLATRVPADAVWRIGPYHFTAAGVLSLGGVRMEMSQAQANILLLFVEHPNQLITYEQIAKHLWPWQKLSANWRRNISLSVHRLRQVFAMGPLGGQIFRSVYQSGYVLHAEVEAYAPPSSPRRALQQEFAEALRDNPFYREAHSYWPNRDPYILPRQEYLLQRSITYDPMFAQGYLELCYFQLLQCVWGMRAARTVLPDLEKLFETVDEFRLQPLGWLGI